MITRQEVIEHLRQAFIDDPDVYAFWLEGADAMGTVDAYSDMDMWFDVSDDHLPGFIRRVRDVLSNLAPIDVFYEAPHGHPQIRQAFIRLKGTTPFLILDICVQSHSRDIALIIENKDEVAKVIFDKADVVRYAHEENVDDIHHKYQMVDEMGQAFHLFTICVEKGLQRRDYLEALSYYHEKVLSPLVKLCRMVYEPTKATYGLKHLRRDLPEGIANRIELMYRVASLEDIQRQLPVAITMFDEMVQRFRNQCNIPNPL